MRQVKIIPTYEMQPRQIEETINEIMREVSKKGGYVEKTKYCVDRDGDLNMVIIEYDA